MADAKISALTGATTPLAGTEVLPIVQSGSTRKVATDNLTVKNIRSNATTGILQIAGPTAAATRTMTVPDANFTAARTDAAQSFSGLQTFGGGVSSTDATLTTGGLSITASEAYSELRSSGGIGSNTRVRFRAVYTGGGSGYGGSFELETRTASNVYNTGAFTVTDAGNLSTTGNLIIGTSGKGIDFSDTSGTGTSELLADYEEGTWTPVLIGQGTPGTYETQLLSGKYTKIGNIVVLDCLMRLAAVITGGGTSFAQITGLPYSIAGNSGAVGSVSFSNVDFTAGAIPSVRPVTSASTAVLYFAQTNDNAAASEIPISGFAASDLIYFTLTYRAA